MRMEHGQSTLANGPPFMIYYLINSQPRKLTLFRWQFRSRAYTRVNLFVGRARSLKICYRRKFNSTFQHDGGVKTQRHAETEKLASMSRGR